jgi:hypothetical protein
MKVEQVTRIGPAYGARLRAAGVASTHVLLMTAGNVKGREALALVTGISTALLLGWVHHADLMRVEGVDSDYANLLEAAGVDSCAELAQWSAASLCAEKASVNDQQALGQRLPSRRAVRDWICKAKQLPHLVAH